MKTSAWKVVALMSLLVGCGTAPEASQRAKPLEIPPASAVEGLHLTLFYLTDEAGIWPWNQSDHPWRYQDNAAPDVNGRQWIEKVLDELRRLSAGSYYTSLGETPPQEYSVGLHGYDELKGVIWVGAGWLGGVDTLTDKKGTRVARYRRLSPEEYARLAAVLREAILSQEQRNMSWKPAEPNEPVRPGDFLGWW